MWLVKHSSKLMRRPSLERLIDLISSQGFGELRASVVYLKEYDLGIDIFSRIIAFIEKHPKLDFNNAIHKRALITLWEWKLLFLDKADRWDEYVATVDALRQRPELSHTESEKWMNESILNQYKAILARKGASRPLRAYLEQQVADVERAIEWRRNPDGSRSARIPAKNRHIVDYSHIRDRFRVVKRKLSLKARGNRTKYVEHRQVWEMTEDEYNGRVQWLRIWRAYSRDLRRERAKQNAH